MPQLDKRRGVYVPVDFNAVEDLTNLPVKGCVTLVLITDGKAVASLNGEVRTLAAPCVLSLSERDKIEVVDNKRLYAQSISLAPTFLKTAEESLTLFLSKTAHHNGVLNLPADMYIKLHECMSIIGAELASQSDCRWTCRIRAYIIKALNMLDELATQGNQINSTSHTITDAVLEHISTQYMNEISLDSLCAQLHTNKTSLNRVFKNRTGQTVIAYLLKHRLRVATELLAHTGLTIDEIAQLAGFKFDTYLIRQFTKSTGQTPTAYRTNARKKYGIPVLRD